MSNPPKMIATRAHIVEARYAMREVIERIGEALSNEPVEMRVAAAQQIVERRPELMNHIEPIEMLILLLAELEAAVVEARDATKPSAVLYPARGIRFEALVELQQIAQDAVRLGWTGEDLHRIGLELSGDGHICWLTSEWVEIESATHQVRKFYRRH